MYRCLSQPLLLRTRILHLQVIGVSRRKDASLEVMRAGLRSAIKPQIDSVPRVAVRDHHRAGGRLSAAFRRAQQCPGRSNRQSTAAALPMARASSFRIGPAAARCVWINSSISRRHTCQATSRSPFVCKPLAESRRSEVGGSPNSGFVLLLLPWSMPVRHSTTRKLCCKPKARLS
jgi:hypothetical protein